MKAEWKIKKLGELCRIRTGKKDVNQGNPDGAYPFFTCAAEHTFSDSYSFNTEALLIAGNGNVGQVSYYNGKFEAYQRTYVLSDFSEIHSRFLFQILDGKLKETVSKQKLGNTMPYIKLGMLSDFLVPIPPLDEQCRIVTVLDEAFADIATAKANAEKNLQNSRELFTRISGSVLAQYASTSHAITLEDLVEAGCSLSYGIVQPGDEVPEGLHIVRPVDMNTDVVMLEGLKRIDPTLANSYARTTLKGKDILLCVRGTTGTVALAHRELAGANVTRGIVPIRFASEKISQQFGYYLLRSAPAQLQIQAKTYGTALQQINIRDLRQLTLPVPARQDQEIIVQRLSALEEETKQLTAAYANKLIALDDLKKSLLHQAFSGQL